MSIHLRPLGLLLAGTLLLAGCASSGGASETSPTHGTAMTPGMTMPDGSTMGADPPTSPATTAASSPSAAAQMVCAAETRTDIKTVLALKTTPVGKATWVDRLYTCTYPLPMGTLTISVKELPDTATAARYFTTLRGHLGTTEDLPGLTDSAYGTPDGTVVLRKDNDVLRVDATALPAEFGTQHQKRADFAYEIASDILGCWTGD